MPTRSDYSGRARPEVLSDFEVSLSLNPVTSDVSRLTNAEAAAQAIRLTLLTINEEWPFEPDNGTRVNSSMFDPSDPVSVDVLRDSVRRALTNRCGAYARVVGVRVAARSDPRYVDVSVAYVLTADPTNTETVRVVLRRVR